MISAKSQDLNALI